MYHYPRNIHGNLSTTVSLDTKDYQYLLTRPIIRVDLGGDTEDHRREIICEAGTLEVPYEGMTARTGD